MAALKGNMLDVAAGGQEDPPPMDALERAMLNVANGPGNVTNQKIPSTDGTNRVKARENIETPLSSIDDPDVPQSPEKAARMTKKFVETYRKRLETICVEADHDIQGSQANIAS